jgi:hypothetical protein
MPGKTNQSKTKQNKTKQNKANQRWRHCLEVLPGMFSAILPQFPASVVFSAIVTREFSNWLGEGQRQSQVFEE